MNRVVIGSALMASDVGCREHCSGVGRRILNRCIRFYVFYTISGYPKLLFIPFPYDLQTHKHKYLNSKQILGLLQLLLFSNCFLKCVHLSCKFNKIKKL